MAGFVITDLTVETPRLDPTALDWQALIRLPEDTLARLDIAAMNL